jgi:hypothetical protein
MSCSACWARCWGIHRESPMLVCHSTLPGPGRHRVCPYANVGEMLGD